MSSELPIGRFRLLFGTSYMIAKTVKHTFISGCLIENVIIFKVARWAGHSTTPITELYSHHCPDENIQRDIDILNF